MFKGFLEDAWTGPQILAHHLLLMLTSDLNDSSKTCPRKESLLHPKLYPGKDIYYLSGYLLSHLILHFLIYNCFLGQQRVDECVVDKLNRSGVSDRQCMQNF